MSDDEKPCKRRGYGLGVVRHLQWLSASISCFALARLTAGVVPGTGGAHLNDIRWLNTAMLAYSVLTMAYIFYGSVVHRLSRLWFILGVVTVTGDVHAIGLLLAKICILSTANLPRACHDIFKEKYFHNELRSAPMKHFPMSGLNTRSFLDLDDVDKQCATTFVTYWLAAGTIILYIISVILTIIRLHKCRKALWQGKKTSNADDQDAEIGLDTIVSPTDSHDSSQPSRSRTGSVRSGASSTRKSLAPSSASRVTPPPSYRTRLSHETTWSYHADLETLTDDGVRIADAQSKPRTSQETTASMAANMYVVSDGFSRSDEPPEYSSKPSSLYGGSGSSGS